MKALRTSAITAMVLGAILLVYMVVVEAEPGALPLLLVIGGALALLIARRDP